MLRRAAGRKLFRSQYDSGNRGCGAVAVITLQLIDADVRGPPHTDQPPSALILGLERDSIFKHAVRRTATETGPCAVYPASQHESFTLEPVLDEYNDPYDSY